MIGDLIRAARKVRGLSQRDLACASGLTRAAIQYMEVGHSRPTPTSARLLAPHLGVDPAALAPLPAWHNATWRERLTILRWRKGWSLKAAAQCTGMALATVWRFENSNATPNQSLLACLTQALCGQDPDVLHGDDPWWRHE